MANGKTTTLEFWENLMTTINKHNQHCIELYDEFINQTKIEVHVRLPEAEENNSSNGFDHINHNFDGGVIRETLEESLREMTEKVVSKERKELMDYLADVVYEMKHSLESIYMTKDLSSFWSQVTELCEIKIQELTQKFANIPTGNWRVNYIPK